MEVKPLGDILSIGRARRPQQETHRELITATEVERDLGIHKKLLYAWVGAGHATPYTTRFTKYTLYSKKQLEQLIDEGLPNSVYRAAQAA